jgi:hypothetical protein
MPKTQTKAELIKLFHILIGEIGFDNDDKLALLGEYGVSSSKDLKPMQLMEICQRLQGVRSPSFCEKDKWRKRLIGAIGAWLKTMDKDKGNNLPLIKGIACRAARCKGFNNIELSSLRGLYFAFRKQEKMAQSAKALSIEQMQEIILGAIERVKNERY